VASGFFEQFIIILGAAVLATALFRRIHLPPILAYIFVGIALGPSAFGLIEESDTIHLLSELGVVFLLFMLGLEFSLPRMLSMRRIVLGMGSMQVAITSTVLVIAALLLGLNLAGALVIAGALALSSTALVTRELIRHGELEQPHGRISVGILLFQDLAAVFFLILIPTLQGGHSINSEQLLLALTEGAFLLVLLLVFGRTILPLLFHEVAHSRSAELFVLTSLVAALTAAWLTHAAGLSMALGGFLAGMMLGESHYKHQLEADIRPFRDLLLGLFFVSVGIQLDLSALLAQWHLVLLGAAGLLLLKTLTVFISAFPLHSDRSEALRAGLCLSQGGEFGFALLAVALSYQLLDSRVNALVVTVIIVTMVMTPALIKHAPGLCRRIFPQQKTTSPPTLNDSLVKVGSALDQHVIICGYGRVGQIITRFLAPLHIPYIVIDSDPVRVREAGLAGEPIYYGDCRHTDLITLLGAERARLLILTFPEYKSSLQAVTKLRHHFRDLPILVRTHDDAGLEAFQALGVTEVIPEALEGSLMLVSHVLTLLDVSHEEIENSIEQVRSARYQMLHGYYHGLRSRKTDAKGQPNLLLHAVPLASDSYAATRTLAELALTQHGIDVKSVRRDNRSLHQPDDNLVLQPGDIVVLRGSAADVEAAEAYLLGGKTFKYTQGKK
jgi:CPA2 family monovalent cation:H+ antiporter-2